MNTSDPLPLVSVLTPSFNQGVFIGDTLHSVACQTYHRIEHVVMDGGSTDGTLQLLERADDHVLWRSEPDRGQAHAVNKAFSRSRGDIIGWLNSDDAYFDCSVIQRVVDYLRLHPQVDVVYGHAARTAADGRVIWIIGVPRFTYARFKKVNYLVQPAVFIRRTAVSAHFLNEDFEFAMDWELWMRLAREGHRFARVNGVLAIDRSHPGRKNLTIAEVLGRDETRLGQMYGVRRQWYRPIWDRYFALSRRLIGARFVSSVSRANFAFAGYVDDGAALLKRQIASRRSRWPDEDRIHG